MTYKECLDYIRSDYYRIRANRDVGIFKMWSTTLLDRGFHFLFWLRLSNCNNIILGGVSRFLYQILGAITQISIQRHTNVDIYQYTTIGSMFMKAAQIGNNVYIGPSVCIVEDVKIGDDATIGAGAIVIKDVEDGCTVAGNPAKIISHKEPGRLIWKRWNREWNKYNKE